MRIERLATALPSLTPALRRLRIALTWGDPANAARAGFEFRVVHHRRCTGVEHRFVWGAAAKGVHGAIDSSGLRMDVRTGRAIMLDGSEFLFREPLFVARPEATAEDDGVLLTVGVSSRRSATRLPALRARDLEPLARADTAHRMPFGFQGAFQRLAAGPGERPSCAPR